MMIWLGRGFGRGMDECEAERSGGVGQARDCSVCGGWGVLRNDLFGFVLMHEVVWNETKR